ncbi:hypothetical protein J1605_017068 [Eschrichtius robustus]|uniref:Uncharacterized protein n=1 Tax=Eschrichtius robustus TaxID=9764 RepID=A0AB34I1U4_ESCRO|nr:hypothetical protein J1605_017068 [Eschrichtius robustus]
MQTRPGLQCGDVLLRTWGCVQDGLRALDPQTPRPNAILQPGPVPGAHRRPLGPFPVFPGAVWALGTGPPRGRGQLKPQEEETRNQELAPGGAGLSLSRSSAAPGSAAHAGNSCPKAQEAAAAGTGSGVSRQWAGARQAIRERDTGPAWAGLQQGLSTPFLSPYCVPEQSAGNTRMSDPAIAWEERRTCDPPPALHQRALGSERQ